MVTKSFLMALAMIESGNRDIPGDNGLAIGPLQIQEIYMAEVNRITEYPVFITCEHDRNGNCLESPCHDDRHSLKASLEATKIYLIYWSARLRRRHGWEFSYNDLCALHRYGSTKYRPNSHKKTLIDRIRSRKLKALMMQPKKVGNF